MHKVTTSERLPLPPTTSETREPSIATNMGRQQELPLHQQIILEEQLLLIETVMAIQSVHLRLLLTISETPQQLIVTGYGNTTGTDRSSTDYYGNTNTRYSDPYGNSRGASSTSTDYFGNTTTTYRDRNGYTQGSSTSSTDYFGNRHTQQRSNNSNTTIWTW